MSRQRISPVGFVILHAELLEKVALVECYMSLKTFLIRCPVFNDPSCRKDIWTHPTLFIFIDSIVFLYLHHCLPTLNRAFVSSVTAPCLLF